MSSVMLDEMIAKYMEAYDDDGDNRIGMGEVRDNKKTIFLLSIPSRSYGALEMPSDLLNP